jgi:hypothetical protein
MGERAHITPPPPSGASSADQGGTARPRVARWRARPLARWRHDAAEDRRTEMSGGAPARRWRDRAGSRGVNELAPAAYAPSTKGSPPPPGLLPYDSNKTRIVLVASCV